jgi:hypothetical protein
LQDGRPFLLGATRPTIFHSKLTLNGFMTFYLQMFELPSHLLAAIKERNKLFLKKHIRTCISINFPTSFQSCF